MAKVDPIRLQYDIYLSNETLLEKSVSRERFMEVGLRYFPNVTTEFDFSRPDNVLVCKLVIAVVALEL